MRYTIICVDDEMTVLDSLRQELAAELGRTYSIEVAESAEEALELLAELLEEGEQIPLIISDQIMPGMKGDRFLVEVKQRRPDIQKIMLSGQADPAAVEHAEQVAELFSFVPKPWDPHTLAQTVREALDRYEQLSRMA